MNFEPELGQMLFGNTEYFEHEVPPFIESCLDALGDLVSNGVYADNPTSNTGAAFSNDTFQMRSYCWCDGELDGHQDGCPPNFVFGDLAITWYKHSHRGASMSREVTFQEWLPIFMKCVNSLEAASGVSDEGGTQGTGRDDDPQVAA